MQLYVLWQESPPVILVQHSELQSPVVELFKPQVHVWQQCSMLQCYYSASTVSGATQRTLTNHTAEQKQKKSTNGTLANQHQAKNNLNKCQTVKIDLKSKHCSYWLPEANSMLSFDWTSCSLIRFLFLFCNVIGQCYLSGVSGPTYSRRTVKVWVNIKILLASHLIE